MVGVDQSTELWCAQKQSLIALVVGSRAPTYIKRRSNPICQTTLDGTMQCIAMKQLGMIKI